MSAQWDKQFGRIEDDPDPVQKNTINDVLKQLIALRAENAKLREALLGFSRLEPGGNYRDDVMHTIWINAGKFRRARAALGETKSEQPVNKEQGERDVTDAEMVKFLGLDRNCDLVKANRYIAGLSLEKRALFERMNSIALWDNGFGPKPDLTDVLLDYEMKQNKRVP